MSNTQIIIEAAINSGFYNEMEIESLLKEGKMPEFHTYTVWKQMGFCPRKGAHGYETRLWRKKNKNSGTSEAEIGEDERNREFYLTKAFLFHVSQCVPINQTS